MATVTMDLLVAGQIRWLVASAKMLDRRSSEVLWRMEITPEIATRILADHNTQNRSIRSGQVAALRDTILLGLWQEDSVIKFDEKGVLLNGQHRLHAIVAANQACSLLISTGCSRESNVGSVNEADRRADEQLKLTMDISQHRRVQPLYNVIRSKIGRKGKLSSAELLGARSRSWWPMLEWAAALRHSQGLTPMSLRVAAMLAAIHGVDRSRIEAGWDAWIRGECPPSSGVVPTVRDAMNRGELYWASSAHAAGTWPTAERVQTHAQALILRIIGDRTGKFQALRSPLWESLDANDDTDGANSV